MKVNEPLNKYFRRRLEHKNTNNNDNKKFVKRQS